MKNKIKGTLFLMITALLWGTSFVAQKSGMDTMGPITFMCLRSLVGAVVLLPIALVYGRMSHGREESGNEGSTEQIKGWKLIFTGMLCGIAYLGASLFQQYGMWLGTTAGKSAFITALYIVITPVIGVLFKKKLSAKNWICVAVAAFGMYLLCINGEVSLQIGDLMTLLCAICFSIHIIVIDRYASRCNCVLLSCIQFFFSGLLALIPMLVIEKPTAEIIMDTAFQVLYLGICSNGIAYTFQMFGQRYLEPSPASLIMSLESVFAAVSGWLILNEKMSGKEIIGCVFIAIAIVFAQVKIQFNSKKLQKSEK